MEITFSDVLKVVNRFKREDKFGLAVLCLESTFKAKGGRAAMAHARRIAAAYRNLRIQRVEARTQELRRQADRMGLRYAS
jgi:hypothetical protein